MFEIVESGQFSIVYIDFVVNRSQYAMKRAKDYNVTAVPHYVFDGGVDEWIGSGGLPQAYISRIDSCSRRSVANLELIVSAAWAGQDLVDITLSAINHESSQYKGRLKVCITEINSRWQTVDGRPFHFTMIGDYALNEEVTIPAGGRLERSCLWDGFTYGFIDLQPENLVVAAALFNGETGFADQAAQAVVSAGPSEFIRGDANADGQINIADAVYILSYLFAGGTEPSCFDAADTNDDGSLNLADAISLLGHLFGNTGPLPSPFPTCGADPTEDEIPCDSFPPCGGK